jgi:hypothetical protein
MIHPIASDAAAKLDALQAELCSLRAQLIKQAEGAIELAELRQKWIYVIGQIDRAWAIMQDPTCRGGETNEFLRELAAMADKCALLPEVRRLFCEQQDRANRLEAELIEAREEVAAAEAEIERLKLCL